MSVHLVFPIPKFLNYYLHMMFFWWSGTSLSTARTLVFCCFSVRNGTSETDRKWPNYENTTSLISTFPTWSTKFACILTHCSLNREYSIHHTATSIHMVLNVVRGGESSCIMISTVLMIFFYLLFWGSIRFTFQFCLLPSFKIHYATNKLLENNIHIRRLQSLIHLIN